MYMYLHVTFMFDTLLSFVYPLSAVQRYAPEAVLLMFRKFQSMVRPCCSTSLLPFSSSLVKIIVGCGLPVAQQNNVAFDPSRTVRSPLILVSLTGTKILSNTNTVSKPSQHPVWHQFSFYFNVAIMEMCISSSNTPIQAVMLDVGIIYQLVHSEREAIDPSPRWRPKIQIS